MMQDQVKRMMCLLCCAFLVLSLLAACGEKGETPKDTDPATVQTTGQPDEADPPKEGLPVADLSQYTIIYPEGGIDTQLYREIITLSNLLKERFGTAPRVSDDYISEKLGQTFGEYEILIGNTNRPESREVCAGVKKALDYEIALRGKKLVIAGCDPEGLLAALQAVVQGLPQAGESVFFDAAMQTSYRGSYELKTVRLGDADISEYTVVYEKNSFCLALAEQIAEWVRARSGWVLPVVEASGADLTQHCILVGNTGAPVPEGMTAPESAGQYYLGASGMHFYLYGVTTPAMYRVRETFLNALNEVTPQSADLSPMPGVVLFADTSITSMSFNLLVSNVTQERIGHVVEMIRKYMPDTLGVQEASEQWMSALKSALSDTYFSVGIGRDENGKGEQSAVLYRKDRFDLVEGGTKWMSDTPDQVSKFEGSIKNRVFSYAILSRKSDGARWMHINVHTDHVNDDTVRLKQVQVLTAFAAQYPDLPVLISGDFNNMEGSKSISHMLSSGVEDSAKVAMNSAPAPTFSNRVIDFIFLSQGDFRVYDYTVDTFKYGSGGKDPSDHCPIIIRFDLLL